VKRAASRAAGAVKDSFAAGARSSFANTGGSSTAGTIGGGEAASSSSAQAGASGSAPPAWAQRMKGRQAISHGATTAAHVLRSGDSRGGGHSVDLSGGE
jgi:type IV secretion system protein TrbL